MAKQLIDGVMVRQLRPIPDERGWLMEMLLRLAGVRTIRPDVHYRLLPGIVKAWHYHKKQDDHFVCIRGMAKVVLFDARDGSLPRG